jgi:tetratricopeptide (TPR) repeat protein
MGKADALKGKVRVREDRVTIPTYEPMAPDKHPMFLDKRVYQGSSGKVYPLPVYNRIASEATGREWKAVHIENEYLKIMVLPEIGGRIHIGHDKTNGYDFFYRQNVIKPALVGLTGPWASGGVEFNWPQHHRPATFMPVDVSVEEHDDGSKTIWFSDHDPMVRMKGMHGVCLHPGKSYVEVKVRAYNRTQFTQTFLWWANVGVRVHEGYQSFFPTDVHYIADHAKRAMATYPSVEGSYYGVDYGKRAKEGTPASEVPSHFLPPHLSKTSDLPPYKENDLTWYANIPVPTSYMCMGSKEDFHGGYDHKANAGVVHVANHHISPGKKQWTWGNHEFGYAWDRNLTDTDGPYIELMAGVYTDNQPDFSFLQPGETKTWSQFWYPIQDIGPAQAASTEAALSLKIEDGKARIGAAVTEAMPEAVVEFLRNDKIVKTWKRDLAPNASLVETIKLAAKETDTYRLRLLDSKGREVLTYTLRPKPKTKPEVPDAAKEPALPKEMTSVDELYLTGLHLDQYRHATRKPEAYWLEALSRDPGESRSNNALGLRCLRRGEFEQARIYFEAAIKRLTKLNPNPYDGEPYYNLGLTLRYLHRDEEAYAAFYKATWNQAWQSAGYHAIAELDCKRNAWSQALDHLEKSLRVNTDNLRARNLRTLVLRKLGREDEAANSVQETLKLDRLDWWARSLSGEKISCETQTRLDLALDYMRAGFLAEATTLLEEAKPETLSGTAPLVQYYLAHLDLLQGDSKSAQARFKKAASLSSDYCFPSRLEEIEILANAIEMNVRDAKAPYYLGNLFYDKDRTEEAISFWELSTKRDPNFSIVWRNLGIAYFNVSGKPQKALAAFEKAVALSPNEARLVYERDQLWKRVGRDVTKRLRELEKKMNLVSERDDLAVELASLYNQTGQPEKALKIITTRNFQPWEGGEGLALGQHVRTHLAIGQKWMAAGDFQSARREFEKALLSPKNLGEAKHLLANQSDIHYWLGLALEALGEKQLAKQHWELAAENVGDFQQMSIRLYSEMTYFSARSLERLGKKAEAQKLFRNILAYAKSLEAEEAKIDYFATSLPTMLLFNDDLQFRQVTSARFMQALAEYGLGREAQAWKLVNDVLKRDPAHAAAADFAIEMKSQKIPAKISRAKESSSGLKQVAPGQILKRKTASVLKAASKAVRSSK